MVPFATMLSHSSTDDHNKISYLCCSTGISPMAAALASLVSTQKEFVPDKLSWDNAFQGRFGHLIFPV
jgi:hypothetical protein